MIAKSERFELRLEPETLERIDGWRGRQHPPPSRAEAVRTLVEDGLQRAGQPRLTDGEKLIAAMLCDLIRESGIDSGFDPDFIEEALTGGHYWALGRRYGGLFREAGGDSDGTVTEVIDILEMWTLLESGHAALSTEAKAKVERETGWADVRFPGFDGNNEIEHLSIARFLVERMDYFPGLGPRAGINSHAQVLESHRRKLAAFRPLRRSLAGREMTGDELIRVLKGSEASVRL